MSKTDHSCDHGPRPLEPAEIAKLNAEAQKISAEAREAAAKADIAEMSRAKATIDLAREEEKYKREKAQFKHQRVYHFVGSVSEQSCDTCMNELNYWSQIDPGCDIEIMFNSPGGSVFAGLAFYDYLQELRGNGHKITTSSRGMAASMGGILLQAGDHRVMGAEAWILIHEVSAGAHGKIGEIEDEVELIKRVQERVLDIFASRSKLSKETLRRRWRRKDWWIDSSEALKLGLVDAVR